MANPPLVCGPQSVTVIGMKHLDQGDDAHFAGAIDDARIYDRALSAEQIGALKPNEPSDPKPWAWWTFSDQLRVFVDKSVVEVFANGRQAVMRRIYPSRKDSVGVALFSMGGAASVPTLEAWDMMPSNPY